MAAAVLTLMLSSTQPHAALAVVPAPAGPEAAGALPDHASIAALVRLPAVPTETRALDVLTPATAQDGP